MELNEMITRRSLLRGEVHPAVGAVVNVCTRDFLPSVVSDLPCSSSNAIPMFLEDVPSERCVVDHATSGAEAALNLPRRRRPPECDWSSSYDAKLASYAIQWETWNIQLGATY